MLGLLLTVVDVLSAQSGPWARYDAKMKGDALIRDSDGGYLREVQSIVEGGGDVNWQTQGSGRTPLMAAASGGHLTIVRFLLEKGADPLIEDRDGRTALDHARLAGASDIVRLLESVERGETPPAPAAQREPTGPWARFNGKMKGEALIRDASGGYLREVQSIVEGGGDVNWQMQGSGRTPLMAAASGGSAEVVRFLLEQGADPFLKDADGRTALDVAVRGGANDVARVLAAAMGVPDPTAPRRRAGAPAPAPAPAPAATAPPSAAPTRPAPARTTATASPASAARWVPFPTYREGDRVQFWAITGWRTGTVREVGPAGSRTQKAAGVYERKYRISDDRYRDGGDWYDWGWVAGLQREPFWTGYFLGDWAVGEGMSVNTRVEGANQRNEYLHVAATETLRVDADGSYRWKMTGGEVIAGRWTPDANGPGIVLLRGAGGQDWTFRNETNATEENIRGIETGRLSSPGVKSIVAKRPIPSASR